MRTRLARFSAPSVASVATLSHTLDAFHIARRAAAAAAPAPPPPTPPVSHTSSPPPPAGPGGGVGSLALDPARRWMDPANLTPAQVVEALGQHIIGQVEAKRAIAVALRNRWRRFRLSPAQQDEIIPKNILMVCPLEFFFTIEGAR
jgi:hypothetical protein